MPCVVLAIVDFLGDQQLGNLELFSEMYVIRPLYKSKKKCSLVRLSKPICYTIARECSLQRLNLVTPELNLELH